jgi:hypothetical protein
MRVDPLDLMQYNEIILGDVSKTPNQEDQIFKIHPQTDTHTKVITLY